MAGEARAAATPSREDYLKAIALLGADGMPVHTGALAARLGVSPGATSHMLRDLARAGFVTVIPYHGATLTSVGQAMARATRRRHDAVVRLLVQELDFTPEDAHEEAERLEHAVSARLEAGLLEKLGKPR